jgi:two-component system response regulator FlrC
VFCASCRSARWSRVGGRKPIEVDVRIVAATHRDLPAEIKAGRFREDLYYRLKVVTIHLPPLRERREDLVPLAMHFIARFASRHGRPERPLSRTCRASPARHIAGRATFASSSMPSSRPC